MASTDAKSGFRLPWSTDRNDSDAETDPSAEAGAVDATEQQGDSESETPTMIDSALTPAGEAPQDDAAAVATDAPVTGAAPEVPAAAADVPAAAPAPAPTRKPNKFMADLTKAMQTAAEAARADTLERFSTEAKTHIEAIHASTADEATVLRKRADDDITSVREWSKQEIARIREETDERIAHRKEVLEREIEAHAAEIEARIEHVQSRVTAFEAEMAAFFEKLLSEDDPTRFAAMAETLPEPPSFDPDDTAPTSWVAPVEAAAVEAPEPVEATATESIPAVDAAEAPEASQAPVDDAGTVEPVAAAPVEEPTAEPTAEAPAPESTSEPAPETAPEDSGDLFGIAPDGAAGETDPRLSALGIEQDFAAAEAEAAQFPAEATTDEQEIPTIAEDALAARLAGLVAEEHAPAGEAASTRVVVTGLVSVASIAGFKRNLARVSGVRSVGVSSGPDGEFVFAVSHDPGLSLTDGIATLPGFGARVTSEAEGELTVAARDPESEG
jgi:hypothetical protein